MLAFRHRPAPRTRRARTSGLALLATGALLALAACGSQGYAPPLGQVARVTLPAEGAARPTGSATITPIRAVRLAVYYHGQLVPRTGAQTPVQIRSGGCAGPIIASLTDGTPAGSVYATPAAGGAPVIVQPADTGVYVSVVPAANQYVTVLAAPNDPTAPVVACGNPLPDQKTNEIRRQYFDLYLPAEVGTGIARGTALFDPINVVRVELSVSDAAGVHPVSWSVRTGSCTGPSLGGGDFAPGTASAGGVVFKTLDPSVWWLSVAHSNGETSCAQVK